MELKKSSPSTFTMAIIIITVPFLMHKTTALQTSHIPEEHHGILKDKGHIIPPSQSTSRGKSVEIISSREKSGHHNHLTKYEAIRSVKRSTSLEFQDDGPMCRHKRYYPPSIFEWDTCGWCYKYMRDGPTSFGFPSKKLNQTYATWTDPYTNGSYTIMTLVDNGTLVSSTLILFVSHISII